MSFAIVPFEDCWLEDSALEVVSGKYRVSQALQAKAELAVTSLQPELLRQLAYQPLSRHTPGGAPVQNSNIATAIRNAFLAGRSEGGGKVLIPPGQWELGDEEFLWTTSHARDNVQIHGSGMDCTALNFAPGYTGTAFKFAGEGSPGDFYYNGGMSNLTINCLTADAGNTGCAIHLEACINPQFRNVTIRNFLGGAGLRTRINGVDGTNQYVQLWNFTCAANGINYDLKDFVNCQGYGVFSTAAAIREMLLDDVKASFYGGNIQTSAPIGIELAGYGACRLVLFDFYYEGFCPKIFKLNTPSTSYNTVDIHGFHVGGNPAVLMDVEDFTNLTMTNIYNVQQATTILKARGNNACFLRNAGDPISTPGKFDLDAQSAGNLVCFGAGSAQYIGTRIVANRGYGLPSYATGSEPASPVVGDTIRNSDYDRPSVKAASSWRRASYLDDDIDLNSMLAPYCADIFDPRIKKKRSVISGALDALLGLINSSSIAALTSGQRPTWNASDDAFGGHPSFTCTISGNKFLQGTLAVPVAVGSHPGVFVVFRVNTAGTDAARRGIIVLENPSQPVNIFCGYSDLNNATFPYCYFTPSVGNTVLLNSPPRTDADAHLMLVQPEPGPNLYFDGVHDLVGSDVGLTSHAMSRVTLGGVFDSLIYAGCDVTIAYAAVLKQPMLADFRARVEKAAIAKYALR